MPCIALEAPRFVPASSAAVPRQGSRRKTVFMIHAGMTAVVTGWGLLYPALHFDAEKMVYPACLTVSAVFLWILWSWYRLRRTLFEPYPLFILSACLFNAGQALLEVFGVNPDGMLGGRISPEILTAAIFQVALSMTFLHGGALAALATGNGRQSIRHSSASRSGGIVLR